MKYIKSKKYEDVYSYITANGNKLYCYRLKYYKDGKRKEKQKSGFRTEKAAYRAVLILKTDLEEQDYSQIEAENITVKQASNMYFKFKSSSWANSTLRNNKNYINNHIIPLIGSTYLSRLTPYEVQTSLINPLQEKVSYRTIYNIYCTFIAILDFMVDNEKLKRNKISGKMHFKEEDIQPIFYNQAILKQILSYADHMVPLYKTIIYTLTYTGMRIGELQALRWTDVDFINHTISIRESRNDHDHFTKTKTKRSKRTIHVDEVLILMLKEYQSHLKNKSFYCNKPLNIHSVIFVGNNKLKPITRTVIYQIFKQMSDDLNIKIHAHAFRHTHASLLLKANQSIFYVADRLGNTPKMIESTYGHIIDSAKRDVSDAFSKILSEEVSEVIPFNAQTL
ncbi:tyrosine-type recombinase/integrase [Mammaliicoccus sciuri]|uniref:tyrosine-type recombinase/integrase n=1 Tax=Mammaliicoccus sciuri TaxID=1296 RepID=UPI003789E1C4